MNDAYINDKVRRVVDPMIMRLRSELFGTTYNKTLLGNLMPPTAIESIIETKYPEIGAGSSGSSVYVYNVGAQSLPAFRLVAYMRSTDSVVLADASNPDHAGLVVGLTTESASPGNKITVQQRGIVDVGSSFSTGSAGTLFLGIGGMPSRTLPAGAAFKQCVGQAQSATHIMVDIEQEYILL